MIISRAPVRITLGGGGTDLESYYSKHGGFLVAAAVDKYVFICANRRFYDSIRLGYSQTEITKGLDEIKHHIFREAMRFLNIDSGIELGGDFHDGINVVGQVVPGECLAVDDDAGPALVAPELRANSDEIKLRVKD